MNNTDPAIFSPEAGVFVNSKFQRLAEIIKDYDEFLELRWIPASHRTSADTKPYAIVHVLPSREPYTVFYFSESDDPAAILARIFIGDNNRGNTLRRIEAQEAAQKIFEHKAYLDDMEEAADQMHFLMTSRSKNWVTWKDLKTGQLVRLDSFRRRVE